MKNLLIGLLLLIVSCNPNQSDPQYYTIYRMKGTDTTGIDDYFIYTYSTDGGDSYYATSNSRVYPSSLVYSKGKPKIDGEEIDTIEEDVVDTVSDESDGGPESDSGGDGGGE
jgi:hypothetical protein